MEYLTILQKKEGFTQYRRMFHIYKLKRKASLLDKNANAFN